MTCKQNIIWFLPEMAGEKYAQNFGMSFMLKDPEETDFQDGTGGS